MRHGGFSLVEISIVLVVVATMLAGVLPVITEGTKVRDVDTTAERLEAIDEAIQIYYNINGELPCPADIRLTINTANFGVQAANPGSCMGGTPTANDETAANPKVVHGGVPTKTLGLPDEYAFDGWGRRIAYHVTAGMTLDTNFSSTPAGSIIIKDSANADRTAAAVYALVSYGRNGHGAWTRAGGTTRINVGSQNTDEGRNCSTNANTCTMPIVGSYDNILVQKLEGATDPNDPTTNFDDIVSYKLKGSLVLGAKEGQSDTSQGLYATWSQSLASGAYVNITGMTTVHNDLPSSTWAGGTFTAGTNEDGWYTISANAYGPNASDELIVAIQVNGVNRALDSGQTAAGASTASASTPFRLSAGDTVRMQVRQLTGATKVFTGSFSIARVSGSVNMSGGAGSSFWADAGGNNINNTNSGNVGIGTASPANNLHILRDYAGTTRLRIENNDSVGTTTDATVQLKAGNTTSNVFLSAHGAAKSGTRYGINLAGYTELLTATSNGMMIGTGTTTNPIVFGNNNAEQMRVHTNGNVGIGTSTPANKLHVSGLARFSGNGDWQNGAVFQEDSSTQPWRINTCGAGSVDVNCTPSGLVFHQSGVATRLAIATSGNVGIGTSTPAVKLDIVGPNVNHGGQLRLAAPDYSQLSFHTSSAGALSTTSRARLWYDHTATNNGLILATENGTASQNNISLVPGMYGGGGSVGIGTTTPQTKLHVEGEIFAGGGGKFVSNMPGTAGASSNVCYSGTGRFDACTSLRKFKDDIKPIDVGLDTVHKLRPVAYKWKESGRADIGFIAEEVSGVDPRFGDIGTNGELIGVRYSQLTALLAKAIQELDVKVDALADGKPIEKAPAAVKQPQAATHSAEGDAAAPLPQWVVAGLIAPWFAIVGLSIQLRRRR